jgi:hypothetical protein
MSMTPERLRRLAERCRELTALSQVPEVKEQLAAWAAEFEAEAAIPEAASPLQHTDDDTLRTLNALSIKRSREGSF